MVATSKFAYRIFGRWTKHSKYAELQNEIRKAGWMASAEMYVSTAILTSLAASIAIVVAGILFAWIMGSLTILVLAPIIIVAPILGFATYRLFMVYPGMIARHRAYKIDLALPQVVGFMHAMSRSGSGIVEIFKELAIRQDVGELRNEAKVFMRDVEYLGQDPLTALRDLARNTPSKRLREFLEVLTPIVQTGGSVTAYFASKWEEYQEDAKADQGKFVSTLELYSELYITAVMLMPLLLLLVFVVIGPLGGYGDTWLYLITYILIPIGSAIFIVLMSMTLPEKIGKSIAKSETPSDAFKEVKILKGGKRDDKLRKSLSRRAIRQKISEFLRAPVQAIEEQPLKVLFFSIPIAAVVVILLYFGLHPEITASNVTGLAVAGILVGAVPFSAAYEFKQMRVGKYEGALLDFLRAIASGIKSGLTLPASLKIASGVELGPLSDEVKRLNTDIEWGASAGEALDRFERKVGGSELTSRAVRTIKKASEADEDISDTLEILMRDVATRRELEREKKGAMSTYNIIMIIMFGIFLFVVYIILKNVLLLNIKVSGERIILFEGLDLTLVVTIFMHATMIEGVSAGILAGQSRVGEIKAGVKYALLMMSISYLMFAVLIFPLL
jgi:flagellar protein FlaJ